MMTEYRRYTAYIVLLYRRSNFFFHPESPKLRENGYNIGKHQEENNMETKRVEKEMIANFSQYLQNEEKSTATIEKYLRDVRAFMRYVGKSAISKELVIGYKQNLVEHRYAVRSINSMLASINSFFSFLGWQDCRVKSIKLQSSVYCTEERELTKEEYLRLLKTAARNPQLQLVMQTICATGIRVSELEYFTLENVKAGEVVVHCKGKTRCILIPGKLRKHLLDYARNKKIRSGVIFLTRSGKPLDRKTIWAQMKGLCTAAGIKPTKVFPHNLRKLFARTFYGIEKDIAKLADILGHSSIDTTRIYIITTGTEHRRKIERLGLVV